jgi:hypothetical protein
MFRSALQTIALAGCLVGCATQDPTYTAGSEPISQVEVAPLPELAAAEPEVVSIQPGIVSAPLQITPAPATIARERPEVAVAPPQSEAVVAPAQPEVAVAPAQPEVAVAPKQPEVASQPEADIRSDQTSEAEPAGKSDEATCRDEAERSNNALGQNRVRTELFGVTPEMQVVYDRCLVQRRSQKRG